MQLRQAEPLGVFNYHNHRVGHVHAHLDDGGGHQQLYLAGGEGSHHRLLVGGFHLAVQQAEGVAAERAVLQLGKHLGGGTQLHFVALLHQRTHDKALPSLV